MKNQDALILIDEIRKTSYRCNSWEKDFLIDIELYKKPLSKKQAKCLTAIYEKSQGAGIYQKREYI